MVTNLCPGPVLDLPVCPGSRVEVGNRRVEEGSCGPLSLDRGEGEASVLVAELDWNTVSEVIEWE